MISKEQKEQIVAQYGRTAGVWFSVDCHWLTKIAVKRATRAKSRPLVLICRLLPKRPPLVAPATQ